MEVGEARNRWTIRSERVVDDSRKAVLSIAEIELPDGGRFEQYVLRLPAAAVVAVTDHDSVLMIHRHRWIIDRWVWELPGGYLDPDEDPTACAAREVEEETGWRPHELELLLSFQPAVGAIGQDNLVYLARNASQTGAIPDVNEAASIAWIPLDEVGELMATGAIVGAASVVGLLSILRRRSSGTA